MYLFLAKKEGGLGIKKLKLHNKILSQKWLWRYSNEDMLLWRNFIYQKYEMECQWITKEVTSTYGCNVWKSIRNLWSDFWANVVISVGDNSTTAFWEDRWIGDGSLKSTFPDLYSINSNSQPDKPSLESMVKSYL